MKRVLVTGMGGELGTRVAQLLEARSEVVEVAGFDLDPPRRRLGRSQFVRIDARDRERVVEMVTEFAPTSIAHFGVYEPHSRLDTREAIETTEACTVHALGAAARGGALEQIALRSGLEVYGRGAGHPLVPDESAQLAPTSDYGRMCLEVEAVAAGIGERHDVPVAALRYASILGSHLPSPLGRVLRLPVVPVPALEDPAFCLVHQSDAALAMVEALARRHDGALNVVAPGATTPWQAARLGGRIPVPVFGPGWSVAAALTELAGAPLPEHTSELLRLGRAGDGARARVALGLTSMQPAHDVCADLYEWATVTPLHGAEAVA